MTLALSPAQALRLRTMAQGLDATASARDVADVVQACAGLQAQDPAAATLGVRARSAGLHSGDVTQAREQARAVVRTWAMRGTLHLVPAADLGWLLPLLGPVFIRANGARRLALALDEATCTRAGAALRAALAAHGPLTRAEIVAHLAARGIVLAGQARPHLLFRAALEGVICCGPDRAGEPTYVLLADWVALGAPLPRAAAATALARRYLAAFGPADAADFAAWSGLPRAEVRDAWQSLAGETEAVEVAGRPAALLRGCAERLDGPAPAAPQVRLLPAFDTYLLGYRSRDLALDPAHARRVNAGGGILHPTVLVDGRVLGIWHARRRRSGLDIIIEPFAPLAPAVQVGVVAEVADVGRFLGVAAQWQRDGDEPAVS